MGKVKAVPQFSESISSFCKLMEKAETLRIAAEAEADANRKIAASLTNELIEKIKYEQWNGELPTVTGSTPIISLEP